MLGPSGNQLANCFPRDLTLSIYYFFIRTIFPFLVGSNSPANF